MLAHTLFVAAIRPPHENLNSHLIALLQLNLVVDAVALVSLTPYT